MGTYLDSYDKAKRFMAGARSKPAGRPLRVSSFRLYQEGDEYIIKIDGWHGTTELCRFLPNNTIVMTAEPQKISAWSHTLTSTSGRALPLYFARFKKGKYRVEHITRFNDLKQAAQAKAGQEDRYGYWSNHEAHLHVIKHSSEYFKGMVIDLNLEQVMNGVPDAVPVIDTDRRKVWLRDIKRFKKMVKARFKLGLAESIQSDLAQMDRREYGMSHPKEDEGVDLVLRCMQQDEYPMELFELFVRRAMPHWFPTSNPLSPQDAIKAVDKFFNKHSFEMREKYGVITGMERPAS